MRNSLVLTPHPGEMDRLLGESVPEMDEYAWSAHGTSLWNTACTVVLKGAYTAICGPDGSSVSIPPGTMVWPKVAAEMCSLVC
ncbi:MAG: hypothetical protein IPI72_00005 [Flavobacteriales bacterium]|nr:hypothetical protein [Flavobacteriales bacterium]